MSDIENIRNRIKGKPQHKKHSFINKFLSLIVITLITLILLKSNPTLKDKFYKYVFNDHISFQKINTWYKKHFGDVVPKIKENTKSVFNETLSYKSKEKYLDGVKLEVDSNYLVPALNSGMVIYIGEKDNYGSTIVIEQTNGIEVSYSNIKTNLKMYDYVDKGTNIGECDKQLILTFKKGDNILNYEDYI